MESIVFLSLLILLIKTLVSGHYVINETVPRTVLLIVFDLKWMMVWIQEDLAELDLLFFAQTSDVQQVSFWDAGHEKQ